MEHQPLHHFFKTQLFKEDAIKDLRSLSNALSMGSQASQLESNETVMTKKMSALFSKAKLQKNQKRESKESVPHDFLRLVL